MIPKKISNKVFKDNRGYLKEIIPNKIKKKFVYSILTTSKKNVLRGMHFDKRLKEEKLVYILEGNILDVTVNLNTGKNFGKIYYCKLKKNESLFIPKGFAHGYFCIGKINTIIYLLTKRYSPKRGSGFIWNDKNFNIKWNVKKPILSYRDKNLKTYKKK